MIDKVVSLGCSFSCWRQDFNTGFVDTVGRHLSVSWDNTSIPGNSNESIVFEFNQRLHKGDLRNSLILFQTTFLTRYAYYEEKLRRPVSLQKHTSIQQEGHIASNFNLFSNDREDISIDFYWDKHQFYRDYHKYIYNDGYEFDKLMYQLYHIQNSVEKIGSKIIFLYFDSYYKLTPIVDKINLVRFDNEISCLNWSLENKLNYSDGDLHLSENGNNILGDYIIKNYL
jgi:hypothetical protein